MTKNILIVDDIGVNRLILKGFLQSIYTILEAESGEEALTLLSKGAEPVSAILLDIGMPGMDGYEVLRRIRSDPKLSSMPVIMITASDDEQSRVRALSLGANDYVTKPYNADIIRHCLRNQIALQEAEATAESLQRDRLTGLYNQDVFFEKAAEMIHAQPEGYYVLCCVDINSFKVINDQYGIEKGDEVLVALAHALQQPCDEQGGICGRMASDNFVTLQPYSLVAARSDNSEWLRSRILRDTGLEATISIGRYCVDDLTLSLSAMYDRARIAQATIKGRFDAHSAMFDESMRLKILREQEIVSEMRNALEQRQFEAWFQPQYNHSTGALIGAEALARWRHPIRGLVPPDEYIPIFEKNGFIYSLDKYIWEETCRCLRKWTDQGRNPLPISVNVSRYDILRPELVRELTGLVEKYSLPLDMLRLEVTESSFSNDAQRVIDVVKELIALGFTVEIDDFGSGFSSLNTLKDVPAQILKLDMKFLQSSEDSERGGNIVQSIVRMAKWLGMSVIAEGVETVEQADFLRSIGCQYVQGYYYARPMPAKDYEEHCKGSSKEEHLLSMDTVENLDNNKFWDPDSMDSLIFNSYVGGAGIFEYHNGEIELLRATETFVALFGGKMTADDLLKLNWSSFFDGDNSQRLSAAIDVSAANKEQVQDEFVLSGVPGYPDKLYVRATLRVIAAVGDRMLVYCTSESVTAQRVAEMKVRQYAAQMSAIMENVNSGITANIVKDGQIRTIFANDKYYSLLGYTREEYTAQFRGQADHILPEDLKMVMSVCDAVNTLGKPGRMEYRIMLPDGNIRWLQTTITLMDYPGVEDPVQLSVTTDITDQDKTQRDLLDNLPGGAGIYEFKNGSMNLVYQNKSYWELVGLGDIAYPDPNALSAIHPEDVPIVMQELSEAMKMGRKVMCDIRLRHLTDGYIYVHLAGRIIQKDPGDFLIYATFTPFAPSSVVGRQTMPLLLSAIMEASNDYSFAKDREFRYICCSPGFLRLAGLEDESAAIGKTDFELFPAKMAEQFRSNDLALFSSGVPLVDFEETVYSSDGAEHYCRASKYILRDPGGAIIGLYGVSRDISAERSALERLRLVNDSMPGGLATYVFTKDSVRIQYCNDGFCRLFGSTRQALEKLGDFDPMDWVLEEDRPKLRRQNSAMLDRGEPSDCVFRIRTKSGAQKWVSYKALPTERSKEKTVANAILFDVTEQYSIMEKLRISEEENHLAVALSGNIVCRYHVADRSLSLEPNVAAAFSLPERIVNVPQAPIDRGMISPETSGAYAAFFNGIQSGNKVGSVLFRQRFLDEWRWIEAKSSTVFSDSGEPVKAVISMLDVTDQLEKELVYKKWQQSLLDMPSESYTLFRCNLNRNKAYESSEGELINFKFNRMSSSITELAVAYSRQCVIAGDRDRFSAFFDRDVLLSGYYSGKRTDAMEYRELLPNDQTRWLRVTIDLVESTDSTDVEAFLLFEDIDRAKKEELQARLLAETDPLTGALNRAAFSARVDQILSHPASGAKYALLMLDIDGFKRVNDVFGHGAGDQALIEISEALRSIVRSDDLVARLGGDEFVVFLNGVASERAALTKARQICALSRKAFSLEVQISGSVGVVMAPRYGSSFAALYKNADAALYYVKGSGKNNAAVYSDSMEGEHLEPEADAVPVGNVLVPEKKRRMLIVDDSSIDHAFMKNIFDDEFITHTAKDGNTALIRLHHYGNAISVVLLDLMMPGMDGFAVLAAMQESPELRSVPVIIVSGDESRDTCLRAIRKGATDFVTKPVDPELLRIRVRSAVSKAENERLRAQNSLLEVQTEERVRYEAMLEHTGIAFIEYDWHTGKFSYHPSITGCLLGNYDDRPLWHILLSDMVADTYTVQDMQQLVHRVAESRSETGGSILAKLKTPLKATHCFRMNVSKLVDEYKLTNKVIITLTDLNYSIG